MKMIVATIRPAIFSDVKDALSQINVDQMTVFSVSGSDGRVSGYELYGGRTVESNLVGKLRVEIAVEDGAVNGVIDAICSAAKTPGDGMISVYTIEQSIKIRTGEEGPSAL